MPTLRPRSTAITPGEQAAALSAPVADPAWFLARQWQTRGFAADDAGDPVTVTLARSTVPLHPASGATALTGPDVEAEPAAGLSALATADRVRVAAELFRQLRDSGVPADRVTAVRAALSAAYPLHPVTPAPGLRPHTGRIPDTSALTSVLATTLADDGTGPLPAVSGLDLAIDSQAEPALRAWYVWARRAAGALQDTTSSAPAAWDATQLSYTATAKAQLSAGTLSLTLDAYDGTGLDWYCLDRDVLPIPPVPPAPPPGLVVRPAPVTFAGMPDPRFWAFERGDVNLDMIAGTDPAHALLTTFAHSYSNDWFLIPLDVEPGITTIDQLTVTDSFGDPTTVHPAAAIDGAESPWQMWELSTPATPSAATAPADAALGARVFLPPAAPPLESAAKEDVLIARDEMANLGWIIELNDTDEDGTTVDRNRRWLRLRPATDPTYNPATAGDNATYRLGTTLPDNWYPLLGSTTADGTLRLGWAALQAGATDVSDDGVTGHLIPHTAQTSLADEEAAGTGIRISQVTRLTFLAGTRRTWRARVRRPGTGEASSGLRFDILGTPAVAPNLAPNPDFARARRQPPPALTGGSTGGPTVAADWDLWNNPVTTTRTWLEPSTRPGSIGWMLGISTDADRCGLAHAWSEYNTGPATARATAWVYVTRGSVTLGSGNGGNTGSDITSTTTFQWEELTAPSGGTPVNEVILYSVPTKGADFYVDFVSVRAG